MKRGLSIMVALVAIMLLLQGGLAGQKAAAAEIDILPYFAAGSPGDTWTYAYVLPSKPDFTVSLTEVTSGPFTGKYRMGDATDWSIYDWDASGLNWYATESKVYDPPVKIKAMQPLDEVVVSPFPEHTKFPWYFQKLNTSLTVLAGTFDNILVHIALDENFGPTSANTEFGLDASILSGVTHVSWMAPGIGEIQNRDYDEYGNIPFEYQLKVSSVPLPTSVVFLGSGLLGLSAIDRKRKFSS